MCTFFNFVARSVSLLTSVSVHASSTSEKSTWQEDVMNCAEYPLGPCRMCNVFNWYMDWGCMDVCAKWMGGKEFDWTQLTLSKQENPKDVSVKKQI